MTKHWNIRIRGRVQGVFFRSATKAQAEKINLTGFVRNEPDDSVYLEVEGEEELLRQFLDWCRQGPSFARIEDIEVKEGELKNFDDFSIM